VCAWNVWIFLWVCVCLVGKSRFFSSFYWRFLNWIGSEFQLEFIHVQFAWFHPLSNFLELSQLLWLSNIVLGFIHYSTVLLNLKFIICPRPLSSSICLTFLKLSNFCEFFYFFKLIHFGTDFLKKNLHMFDIARKLNFIKFKASFPSVQGWKF
jgi:hypothetical protein